VIDIASFLKPSRCADLRSRDRDGAVAELCRLAATAPGVRDGAALARAALEREKVLSTGIGLGIAVPHAKIAGVREFVLALGRSREGIDFGALDGAPVRLAVLIAGPADRQSRYLQILAGVTLRLKREEVRRALLAAPDGRGMVRVLGRA
jgi:PTS system nitrogen regulatory IIA component